jgi:hypothetical protein
VIISFEDDVPFPENNWFAYRKIYVVEQWLRRIALTALMARHGNRFLGALPPEVHDAVKKNIALLRRRAYLGSDDASEALWASTLDELRRVLVADSLVGTVRKLTGLDRALLDEKLKEITEIRNVVGHNRAVTNKTLTILGAAAESLSHGIDALQGLVFRHQYSMFDFDADGQAQVPAPLEHPLAHLLERWFSEMALDFPPGAVRLGESEFLNYAALIPEEFRREGVTEAESWIGRYVDLRKFLKFLQGSLDAILAITVTTSGHTASVVWPKALAPEGRHEEVVRAFVGALGGVWSDHEYALQDERAVCHPKVWFHSAW